MFFHFLLFIWFGFTWLGLEHPAAVMCLCYLLFVLHLLSYDLLISIFTF